MEIAAVAWNLNDEKFSRLDEKTKENSDFIRSKLDFETSPITIRQDGVEFRRIEDRKLEKIGYAGLDGNEIDDS